VFAPARKAQLKRFLMTCDENRKEKKKKYFIIFENFSFCAIFLGCCLDSTEAELLLSSFV
jgi:hypothetical protein